MNLYKLNWNYMLHNIAVRNSYQLYNAETQKSIIIKRSSYAKKICETCDIPMLKLKGTYLFKEYKKKLRQEYLEYLEESKSKDNTKGD